MAKKERPFARFEYEATSEVGTYWCDKGRYQDLYEALHELVPASGPVTGKENSALEKFRKATNLYYDAYNNGLCNMWSQSRKIVGVSPSKYRTHSKKGKDFSNTFLALLEARFDAIIIEAAVEQGMMPQSW